MRQTSTICSKSTNCVTLQLNNASFGSIVSIKNHIHLTSKEILSFLSRKFCKLCNTWQYWFTWNGTNSSMLRQSLSRGINYLVNPVGEKVVDPEIEFNTDKDDVATCHPYVLLNTSKCIHFCET